MDLSTKQQQFLDLALQEKNIFLTGKAGTGKTYITKLLMQQLKDNGKKLAAIAPTGVAANNLGGQTIHSMFSINPYGIGNFEDCNFLKQEKCRLMKNIDVLVIDEISMLRPDVLDAMHWTLLKNGIKNGILGKQIIFIGDLKQLESPIDDNTRSMLLRTYDGQEFYHAKVYEKLDIIEMELDEVLRQSNEDFINALNIVRDGGKSEYFRQFLHEHPNGIILAPHNTTVDAYNKKGLDEATGPTFTFNAKIEGNVKAEDFNLPTKIEVKNGCKIMYLANQIGGELINGSLGVFVSHKNCHFIRVGNIDYALNPVKFTKKQYVYNKDINDLELQEVGAIEQYPFKLAFALSIHKAQGLTFDEVTIDLTRPCFARGQLYVSLSRCTTPEGLRIITKK